MIKRYIAYIQDNPEGYWFKRKLYGWGWTPATWQGWSITLIYLGLVIALAISANNYTEFDAFLFKFIIPVVVLSAFLIHLCYARGEKPRWQWGVKK